MAGKARSIMPKDDEHKCYMCEKQGRMELHHVYFGKNRKISDEQGFVVHLCRKCHREDNGVHGKYGFLMDTYLKKTLQLEYEKTHSREEFMRLIGCNYLEEDED